MKSEKIIPGLIMFFICRWIPPFNAKRFLDLVDPSLVLWIKYDYWYYYLRELRKRKIPALLVSPVFRPDQPFFKWYGNIHRLMLDSFHAFFVQNEDSRQLLGTLGIDQSVFVSGDTRFDRVTDIAESYEPLPVIDSFCKGHTVIVAGSTWEEDEEELDHYANTHPDIRFIIAPHEIEEDHLQDMEALFRHTIRYSELEKQYNTKTEAGQVVIPDFPIPNVLIIDNIGMLARLYYYAQICYVGGGFGEDGVHNVLEAAVYGKPVITGPVIEKYIEVMELAEAGGVISSTMRSKRNQFLAAYWKMRRNMHFTAGIAREYVYARKGATEKIIRYIQENRLLTS